MREASRSKFVTYTLMRHKVGGGVGGRHTAFYCTVYAIGHTKRVLEEREEKKTWLHYSLYA